MIERLRRLLENYKEIIANIESLSLTTKGKCTILRLKVILIDQSRVYIREIWRGGSLVDYSYWWVSSDDSPIEGWDNAPHHPEIPTYPHHKHTKEGVKELRNPQLEEFFKMLRNGILQPIE